MRALRLLNPLRIYRAAKQIKAVAGGGGPAAVRLAGVGRPAGLIIPTSEITLEVLARDGTTTRFTPALPVPFPYAWAYRVARRLGVPLVSSLDPERIDVRLTVPRRGGRGGNGSA